MARKSNTGWYVAGLILAGGALYFGTRREEVPLGGRVPWIDDFGMDTRDCTAIRHGQEGDPINPALWRVYSCGTQSVDWYAAVWERSPSGAGESTPYFEVEEAVEAAREGALTGHVPPVPGFDEPSYRRRWTPGSTR